MMSVVTKAARKSVPKPKKAAVSNVRKPLIKNLLPLKLVKLECSSPVGPFFALYNTRGEVVGCNWTEYLDRTIASVERAWGSPVSLVDLTSSSSAATTTHQHLSDAFTQSFAHYFNPANDKISPAELEKCFEGVQLAYPPSLSPFTRAVWEQCRRQVPAGKSVSYAELGRLAYAALQPEPSSSSSSPEVDKGRSAARAVGGAMNANPYVIVVPCHRVVAATGGLNGYGCGLYRKVWLLRHEQCALDQGKLKLVEKEMAVCTAASRK